MLRRLFPHADITGVDISELALESNARRFPFDTFEVLDIQTGKLDRSFDLVTSSEVVEHLNDQHTAVMNLAAMVAPGGSLLISVPAGRIFATERTFGHVRHPELEWLTETLETQSLTVTHTFRWGFPTYLSLKYATNVRPEISMREFGWGSYGPFKRRLNDAIYLANFANLEHSRFGCRLSSERHALKALPVEHRLRIPGRSVSAALRHPRFHSGTPGGLSAALSR